MLRDAFSLPGSLTAKTPWLCLPFPSPASVCPFAQRAWISVEETGAPFEWKDVNLDDKSPEFVALYRQGPGWHGTGGLIVAMASAGGLVPWRVCAHALTKGAKKRWGQQ
jgi:hypothetical protein